MMLPLSTGEFPFSTQIRDVQLLLDMIRIDEIRVFIFTPCLLGLLLRCLLLLEFTPLSAAEFGFRRIVVCAAIGCVLIFIPILILVLVLVLALLILLRVIILVSLLVTTTGPVQEMI